MVAVLAGFKDERKRARNYLEWLLQQRRGPVSVDTRGRDDVTVVEVPRESVGYITGHKGESLREIERQTGTFCFANGEKGSGRTHGAYENLLIFGASSEARPHGFSEGVVCERSGLDMHSRTSCTLSLSFSARLSRHGPHVI